MTPIRKLILTLGTLLPVLTMAQPAVILSGIINDYYPVEEASCNYVKLGSIPNLDSNDKVLIIQMTGALADSSNSPQFGFPFTVNECGNYEFARVNHIHDNTVFFNCRLIRNYNPHYKVQLVKVPEYTKNIMLAANVYAKPWDGTTGGIVAFETTGDIFMNNHHIIASGSGFPGGGAGPDIYNGPCTSCQNRQDNALRYYQNPGGYKGGGIFSLKEPMETGIAPAINGGGGGNCKNAGGGGGANAGAGGQGGMSSNECTAPTTEASGKGGHPVSNGPDKIFMGGGGGGGNQDNPDLDGSGGGKGGGIVYIKAERIWDNTINNIGTIRADGISVHEALADGAGGGGAGGTVLLDIGTLMAVPVIASGGTGGSTRTGRDSLCYGPGGGGGGGLIWYTPRTRNKFDTLKASLHVNAGEAGSVSILAALCGGENFGADSGRYGQIRDNLVMPEGTVPWVISFYLGRDTFLCDNIKLTLDAGAGYRRYLWSNGDTTQTSGIKTPGLVSVELLEFSGCMLTDSLMVTDETPQLDLGNDTTLCPGLPVGFNVDPGFKNYTWSDGDQNASRVIRHEGKFWLTIESQKGCIASDTVEIVNSTAAINLGKDTVICVGRYVALDAGSTYTGYTWKYGKTGQYYHCTYADTIWVSTQAGSCLVSDTIIVGYTQGKKVNLGMDSIGCTGSGVRLDAGSSHTGIEWSTGDTGRFTIVWMPGTFIVKAIDSNQCRSADTIQVSLPSTEDFLYLPNAFRPDRNGRNDFFPYENAEHISNFHMSVYNLWGEKVFESDAGNKTWDGTYMGHYAEEGMYYYLISWVRCNGRLKNTKGTFMLLR